jgi:GrpB-like predicted nucleotidyltransferase (UPF0157 family)
MNPASPLAKSARAGAGERQAVRTDMTIEIDEPTKVVEYNPRWVEWYAADAEELTSAFGARLREVQHFGSTSVPGIVAKPILDILVAPEKWPLTVSDREMFEALGYEHLGEAGVPGREHFRRRDAHDTNLRYRRVAARIKKTS